MASSADFTPVKVRGKRGALSAEKWRAGKRRDPELQTRPAPVSTSTAVSRASSSRPRKRRRDTEPDSPLEALPAEILQEIFDYAANVDLAIVSRQLALKLSKSRHLQIELTSRLLTPVLDSHGNASGRDLAAATRLLNSRFMTWDFFKTWLQGYSANVALSIARADDDSHWQSIWAALNPASELLPPNKLFLRPFTDAKLAFLRTLAQNITDLHGLNAAYAEHAQEGLMQAVTDGNAQFVSVILGMGARTNTELLRVAVADSGCHREIVENLVRHVNVGNASGGAMLDVLDPVLWQWAERAQEQGNYNGEWLVALLQKEQRRRESTRD
ncbi:hypothetical protein AC578_8918 [Pseudocercospora eumusae]|uniref:F-box domain-containing protein n=1 Tax=Pseudocercospora eumusae TaxID=321146 RepID=A0A139HNC8_9PEZI|nr:hypothetical protein AC578_8918 [Pseudocercospora eumusae]